MSGMALELEGKGIISHAELDLFIDEKDPPNLTIILSMQRDTTSARGDKTSEANRYGHRDVTRQIQILKSAGSVRRLSRSRAVN